MGERELLEELGRLREQVERAASRINELNARLAGSGAERLETRGDDLVSRLEMRVEEVADLE